MANSLIQGGFMTTFIKPFLLYLLIAALPIIILKVYIEVTGNLDARWLVIQYSVPMVVWSVVFVAIGIFKGIKKQKLGR